MVAPSADVARSSGAQLVPLPTLPTRCWLECGVVGGGGGGGGGCRRRRSWQRRWGGGGGLPRAGSSRAGGGGVSQRPWRRRRRRPCTGLRPGICRRVQAAADERSDRRCSDSVQAVVVGTVAAVGLASGWAEAGEQPLHSHRCRGHEWKGEGGGRPRRPTMWGFSPRRSRHPLRHVAPHVPLLRQRSTASGAAAAAFCGSTRRCARSFACYSPRFLGDGAISGGRGAGGCEAQPSRQEGQDGGWRAAIDADARGTLPAVEPFLCEELGAEGSLQEPHSRARRLGSRGGGKGGSRRERARAAAAAAARDVPALLRSARLLLGGSWRRRTGGRAAKALPEFWESAPPMTIPPPLLRAPSRSSCHSALPSKVFAMAMVTMAMVVVAMVLAVTAPPLATTRPQPPLLHLRAARSLSRAAAAFRQLQIPVPRSPRYPPHHGRHRPSDELRTLQPALVPYFCMTRRRGQPDDAPLLGPFCTAPPRVRQTACHLLARFHPLSSPMAEALAACASSRQAAHPSCSGWWRMRRGGVEWMARRTCPLC